MARKTKVSNGRSSSLMLGVAITSVIVGILWATVGTAIANGGTRPVVKNERVGPYELEVGILPGNPRVGTLHLSILVKDLQEGKTITNADVTVMANGPEGATNVDRVRAANTLQTPQFYEKNILLDMKGSWTLTLEVASDLGEAELVVPLEVSSPSGFNFTYVIAVAIALLALSVWTWDRIKGRKRRRQKA